MVMAIVVIGVVAAAVGAFAHSVYSGISAGR